VQSALHTVRQSSAQRAEQLMPHPVWQSKMPQVMGVAMVRLTSLDGRYTFITLPFSVVLGRAAGPPSMEMIRNWAARSFHQPTGIARNLWHHPRTGSGCPVE